MNFIEALKLKSKLFFLFILITLGLISVGIVGSMHISDIKKNIDSLYFGSLVPVTELNEILQQYHNGLAGTIQKVSREEITTQESILNIEESLKKIQKKWKSYESHYKRDDELVYVEYAALEIKNTNNYFLNVLKAAKDGVDLKKLSLKILGKKVSHIDRVIQKLITYEVNIANYERKQFLNAYSQTSLYVGISLLFIIAGVLLISLWVFISIQDDQSKLELTTKKLRRANKKLESASYTDSLTSLHNRRYFNLVYDRELKQARRVKSYITFMMLDIDYFKQFNDTYGHVEGDYALKSVAKVLKDTLKRPTDYVFRLGGEEFGILLTNTDETSSAKLAREICDAVRGCEIEHINSQAHEYLTISIGIVCCIADNALDDEILISRADEMLYEAKETGRDRYVITSNASAAKVEELEALIA